MTKYLKHFICNELVFNYYVAMELFILVSKLKLGYIHILKGFVNIAKCKGPMMSNELDRQFLFTQYKNIPSMSNNKYYNINI